MDCFACGGKADHSPGDDKCFLNQIELENKRLEEELKEVLNHRKSAHGHFCAEYDGLYIEDTDPEFESCLCFKKGD